MEIGSPSCVQAGSGRMLSTVNSEMKNPQVVLKVTLKFQSPILIKVSVTTYPGFARPIKVFGRPIQEIALLT